MSLRVISYGGGVQATALLVLAATKRIDFGVFLFANVGDDSEDRATLDYLNRWAKPYAARHGIQLIELHRHRRDGTTETLYGRLTRPGSRSLPIPVRMSNGARRPASVYPRTVSSRNGHHQLSPRIET
jgi:sugar/nucleoside kinase (ribokinase family)